MIEFGPEVCGELEPALSKEWLETNGLGGFASSTVVGLNTRRYHGLLVGCVRPPVERVLFLSKLEETLIVDGQRYELSANLFPGTIHPEGYRYLVRFRLDPWPVWTYRVNEVELEKALFLVHGENTVVVRYSFSGSAGAALELRPLVAFRGYHELTHENGALNPEFAEAPGRIT